MRSGDGGGRIVLNPAELRRGATRLRTLSGELKPEAVKLEHAPTPLTAPEVAAVPAAVHEVGSVLDTLVLPLAESAKELDRRALWADIADQLIAGVPLTAAQLNEFMAGLRDGSLVKYAEPWQAALAGEYVGRLYHSSYDESPEKLRELVTLLRANGGTYDESHGAFFAGFVNTFGATNVAHIARVIQEMEIPGAYQSVSSPHDTDRMFRYFNEGVRLSEQDAMDFMLTFGMALSVATYTGQLTRYAPGAAKKIAYDPDAWSVAQLLAYNGPFSATFLRDVFQNGVIAQIGREVGNVSGIEPWEQEIRIGDISADQTRLILDALARNPHAAALALSDPIPPELQISYLLEGNSNPLAVLYDHMQWDDDGEEFARLYRTGIDWCYDTGDRERAYHMTASLIDRTINSDWRHLEPMTVALASDLNEHHMADLFLSAASVPPPGPSGDFQAGWVGYEEVERVNRLHLLLEKGELTELVRTFRDHEEANDIFLAGVRDQQADLIRMNTTEPATATSDLVWARQIGSFDGILLNAYDLDVAEDYDKDNLQHQVVFKVLESVIGAVGHAHPYATAGTALFVEGIDEATKPSYEALVASADSEKELLIATTHAAIVAGYYENGVLGAGGAPPPDLLQGGHLVAFTELTDPDPDKQIDKIRQYVVWLNNTGKLEEVAGEAWDRVDQARDNRTYPVSP